MRGTCGCCSRIDWYRWAMLQRCGTAKSRSGVSSAQALPVMLFRQVRNGTSSLPSASRATYPCIIPLKPMAATVFSSRE